LNPMENCRRLATRFPLGVRDLWPCALKDPEPVLSWSLQGKT
jgi:hypothetical protein